MTNDNVFNIQIEKSVPKEPEDRNKDILLQLAYAEDNNINGQQQVPTNSLNRTWTAEFVKSVQSVSLVFTNEIDENEDLNTLYKNRTGIISVNEIGYEGNAIQRNYDLLVFNVLLYPQNMADNSLPKNIYVNVCIVNDKVLPVTDFFNQRVYKLSRDHNKENFIHIELSSCLGEVDF
jgi:hypothetical protein